MFFLDGDDGLVIHVRNHTVVDFDAFICQLFSVLNVDISCAIMPRGRLEVPTGIILFVNDW